MSRWTLSNLPSQAGRLAVVTGPTGLGYEVGLALARAGAEVVLAGRNPTTGEASVQRVRDTVPGAKVRFGLLDLANLASVSAFANGLLSAGRPLDLLINNAGVMMPPRRKLTADGFELQLGTNYLGHFALTAQVLPLLRAADAPRVVNVSSIAAIGGRLHFDDLQFSRGYEPGASYAQSKLAMLMFALELQRQSDAGRWGVTSIGAHPGVARTDLIAKGPGSRSALGVVSTLLPFVRQSAAQGALPLLYAAADPTAEPGGYYGPDGFQEIRGYPQPARIVGQARDRASSERLWAVSEQLTGVRFAEPALA